MQFKRHKRKNIGQDKQQEARHRKDNGMFKTIPFFCLQQGTAARTLGPLAIVQWMQAMQEIAIMAGND
jgi:hypothetical protein